MEKSKVFNRQHAAGENHRILGVRPSLLVLLILLVSSYLVFHDMFGHPFIEYDDYPIIVERLDKYDGLTFENIRGIVLEDFPREEPLIVRDLSYLVNAEIFGVQNPKGYLLGNFVLHVCSSYLVYLLALRLYPGKIVPALAGALLFSIHPIHVESVAWISSRKDPLYVVFFLSALLSYMAYLRNFSKRWLGFSFLLVLFSFFSKSAAISFFPVVVTYRFFVEKKKRFTLAESIYGIALIFATLLFVYWYSDILKQFGVLPTNSSIVDRNWVVWLLSSCTYVTFYIQKLILPLNQSTFYDYPASPVLFEHIGFLLISMVVISISGVFLWQSYKYRAKQTVFLGLFFLFSLLPFLELAQVGIYVADRYAYLSSAPFLVMATVLVGNWVKKLCGRKQIRRGVAAVVLTLFFIFWSTKSIRAVTNWETTMVFWQNALKIAPGRADPYKGLMRHYIKLFIYSSDRSLGKDYLLAGRRVGESAVKRFCQPDGSCPKNMATLLEVYAEIEWNLGNKRLAEKLFQQSLSLSPTYVEGAFMYATFLVQQTRYQEALEQIRMIEKSANPYMNRNILVDIQERLLPLIEKGLNSNPGLSGDTEQ